MQLNSLLAVAILFVLVSLASAQVQDSQQFSVIVPEGISLRAPGGVVISHDLETPDEVFPIQVWEAFTTNTAGANVTMTIGRFLHQDFIFFRANSSIVLNVVETAPAANWTTIVNQDQTSGFFGTFNSTATVSAESFGPGSGRLGVTVSFIGPIFNVVAAGDYVATVVGQITNK